LLTGSRYLKEPLPTELKEVAENGDFKLFEVAGRTR